MLVFSEVRVEGLETMDYLDNLQKKERFTEQGDALTFESEVRLFTLFCYALINKDVGITINMLKVMNHVNLCDVGITINKESTFLIKEKGSDRPG